MNVKDVMTTGVITVTPETSLKEAAITLVQHSVSGVPVVDESGALVGVLSEADILVKERGAPERSGLFRWFVDPYDPWIQERFNATNVAEAMSSPPITIHADRPLAEAAGLMLDEGINRLPVVDENGKLVGLISRGDLVRSFARSDDEIRDEIEGLVVRKELWLDPRSIDIAVNEGVVVLSGEVDSEADARLLETFARRIPGVVSVTSTVKSRDKTTA